MRHGVVALLAVILAACAAAPPRSEPASVGPRATLAPIAPVAGEGIVEDRATIVQPVQPRWSPGDAGIGMTDDWAEHPAILEPPVAVSVLDGPTPADGTDWYRVYVLPDAMRWPSDFVAWVPASLNGAAVMRFDEATPCPNASAPELGVLSPRARVACFGDRSLTLVAQSWRPGYWTPYRTDPAWLGSGDGGDRSVSLFENGGGMFPRPPDARTPWIDARVPPDLEMPPVGMTLRVEGRFDHPAAADCARTRDRSGPPPQPPLSGIPDEEPDASALWCRGQLVLTDWEVLLGPEGRPPVAGEVQLHRAQVENGACAGVGMPMMRFRMDLRQADPIWLEAEGFGQRIVPVFGRAFRAVAVPDLAILDERGRVVARDGTPLDPDQPFAGHFVCPMGDTVSITGP